MSKPGILASTRRGGGGPTGNQAGAGSLRSRSTTGADTVNLGFQPKAVILTVTGPNFDDTNLGDGITFAQVVSDGTRTRCVINTDDDTADPTAGSRGWFSNIRLVNSSQATTHAGDISFTTTGFEIDWTTMPSAVSVTYWAIGGDDIDAYLKTFSHDSTTTGMIGYTGVGFQPKVLYGITALEDNEDAATATDPSTLIGMADTNNVAQRAFGMTQDYNTADSNTSVASNANNIFVRRNANNDSWSLVTDVDSFDADGFTLEWKTLPSAHPPLYYAVLCLGGSGIASSDIVEITADTTSGAHTQNVTIDWFGSTPFTPDTALIVGSSQTGFGDSTIARLVTGYWDSGHAQAGSAIYAQDGTSVANTKQGASSTAALVAYSSGGTDNAWDALGEITGFSDTTVNIDWATGKTTAAYFWSLLILEFT